MSPQLIRTTLLSVPSPAIAYVIAPESHRHSRVGPASKLHRVPEI
jgi:hypothetical protein